MNLSRRILLVTEVLYLLCCSALIDAQEFYCGTEDGLSEKSDIPGCAVNSDYNILSYYSDIDDYTPDANSRTIYKGMWLQDTTLEIYLY